MLYTKSAPVAVATAATTNSAVSADIVSETVTVVAAATTAAFSASSRFADVSTIGVVDVVIEKVVFASSSASN